jgi:signal transduction histidine kinase
VPGPDKDLSRGSTRVIVHELRAPITVIRGYTSLLLEGNLSEEGRLYALEVIGRRARDLSDLLDGLHASLNGDQTEARCSEFDIRLTARRALQHLEPRARLEGAELELAGLEDSPVLVRAVEQHVLCILCNLLGNALSYSARPARVRLEIRGTGEDTLELAVSDNGYGIPPEHHGRIFQSGERLCKRIDGFGLGLAISRELAERNGGQLELEWSQPGIGSVFVLRLARAEGASAEELARPPRRVSAGG